MPTIAPQAAQGTVIATGSLIAPGGQSGLQGNTGAMGDGMPVGMVYAYTSVTPPLGSMLCDGSAISRSAYPALFTLFGTQFGIGDGSTTFNLPDLRSRFILGQGQGSGLTNRVIAATGGEENHVLTLAEITSHTHGLGNHTHPGGNHLHDLQGHTHAGANHLHSMLNHTHGIGSQINYASIAVGTSGQGPYQFLFTPHDGSIWLSGTTGGPSSGTTDWADRSLTTGGPSPNNTGWVDRDITTGGPSTNTSDAAGSGSGHNTLPPYLVLVYMIKVAAGSGPSNTAPLADTTQNGLLRKVSGLTTDFVDGTNNCQDLGSAIKLVAPVARSYNSFVNPNFEYDARTRGAGAPSTGGFALDRWYYYAVGTNRATVKQMSENVVIAGTNFCISSKYLRYTLTTQQSTLAAGDLVEIVQWVEGPRLRELLGGQTAVSIVCRSSVPNTVFGYAMQDSAGGYSLTKLCTLTNANAWTLISVPSIATWTPSGTFPSAPGGVGYVMNICLAAGSNFIPPANDVWNAASFNGAKGQGNFAANPVNSTFDLAWVQHEPGSTCGGILDKDWMTNEWECKRYWSTNLSYQQPPTTAWQNAVSGTANPAAADPYARCNCRFPREMAKSPTMTIYPGDGHGDVGKAYDYTTSTYYAAAQNDLSAAGCGSLYFNPTAIPAGHIYQFHYFADTGW